MAKLEKSTCKEIKTTVSSFSLVLCSLEDVITINETYAVSSGLSDSSDSRSKTQTEPPEDGERAESEDVRVLLRDLVSSFEEEDLGSSTKRRSRELYVYIF